MTDQLTDRTRRRRHTARWVAGAMALALIALSIVLATRPAYQATEAQSPLLGNKAPSIKGLSYEGEHISLSAFRGRFVFVNFFASWCSPCSAEEPNLVDFNFEQQESPTGARMLSVDIDDSASSGRNFVRQFGAIWPTLPDKGGTIANAYGVGSPPATFLIDPDGVVVYLLVGPVEVRQLNSALATARRAFGSTQ